MTFLLCDHQRLVRPTSLTSRINGKKTHHTTIIGVVLEHKERYDIITTDEEWHILVKVVVVVVVDSHMQRIVLATEETTVTQQVSHKPLSNANPACGHKEVRRSTGHIVVTTRYSDQQASKSRQKVMRLHKQWHRPISKRFIKPPYSISRATSIDSECCRLPTTSVLSKNRGNYAPTSFEQQVQVSQGHTLYKNKGK